MTGISTSVSAGGRAVCAEEDELQLELVESRGWNGLAYDCPLLLVWLSSSKVTYVAVRDEEPDSEREVRGGGEAARLELLLLLLLLLPLPEEDEWRAWARAPASCDSQHASLKQSVEIRQ